MYDLSQTRRFRRTPASWFQIYPLALKSAFTRVGHGGRGHALRDDLQEAYKEFP